MLGGRRCRSASTNVPDKRLAKHKAAGWVLIGHLLGPVDGHCARDHLERDMRAYLKLQGLLLPGKQEDWLRSQWPVSTLDDVMRTAVVARTCRVGAVCHMKQQISANAASSNDPEAHSGRTLNCFVGSSPGQSLRDRL